MTEKRFTIIHIGNPYECVIKDHITDNTIGMFDSTTEPVNEVVECLNALHEENSLLKDIIKDIVIKLEANYTSNTYEMTIPINRVIYNELRRRLKETSFNEDLRRFLDD